MWSSWSIFRLSDAFDRFLALVKEFKIPKIQKHTDYTNAGQDENTTKIQNEGNNCKLATKPSGKKQTYNKSKRDEKQVTKRSFCFKIIIILSSRTCFFILLDSRSGSSQRDV